MHDLVIRGATVVDGLGHDPIRADVAVKDGRIAAIGEVGKDAAQDGRCRRARADAGHHRSAHALRRAGHLGPDPVAVALARRHHGGDGQLRLRHRAEPAAAARHDHAQPRRRRGHGPRRAARRHRLALPVLRRIHGDAARPRPLHEPRGAGRAFGGAHRRHGRGGLGPQRADRRRIGRDEAPRRRGDGPGRDRARRLLFAEPFGLGRRADAVDDQRSVGIRRAGRGDGRPGPRRRRDLVRADHARHDGGDRRAGTAAASS